MVTAHARGLLSGSGNTRFVEADLRDPDGLLGHPGLREFIDPVSRPGC
jgi:S-adenosyl methyltransferase